MNSQKVLEVPVVYLLLYYSDLSRIRILPFPKAKALCATAFDILFILFSASSHVVSFFIVITSLEVSHHGC